MHSHAMRRTPAHAHAQLKSHPFFAGINWDDVYARRYRPEFIPPPNGVAVVAELSEDGAGGGSTVPGERVSLLESGRALSVCVRARAHAPFVW